MMNVLRHNEGITSKVPVCHLAVSGLPIEDGPVQEVLPQAFQDTIETGRVAQGEAALIIFFHLCLLEPFL